MADAPDTTRRSSRMHPPFTAPGEKLPSIVDFLEHAPQAESEVSDESADRVPSISEFLAGDQAVNAGGWAVAGWQSYDWSGAAGLASDQVPSERKDADADWTATDWTPRRGQQHRPPRSPAAFDDPSADEVASAFGAIAHRIRSGELSIDQFRGTPPEAALAAALGWMLKLRR